MEPPMPDPDLIFSHAVDLNSTAARRAYLDKTCGHDGVLRQRLDELIEVHLKASSGFLESPADGLQSRLDADLVHTLDLNPAALNAGFAATFDSHAAVIVGSRGHSAWKPQSKQLPNVPLVSLQAPNAEHNSIVQPGSPQLPKDEIDSRYQFLGEIARGGMGAIIQGRNTNLGRDLAIQVMLDTHRKKPDVIQRIGEEAQCGGQLQHPSIAPVYELGQFADQRPFFTMKLVQGQTLAAILAARKGPSVDHPKLLGIFEQICQTMAYAHNKGVIHRDLKPTNIMVGEFGEVQVMNWGLSTVLPTGGVAAECKQLEQYRDASAIETCRSVSSDNPASVGPDTKTGSVMGTGAYMPPEQARGQVNRLDKRGDVFGLGAILAEILTGKPAYVANDASEVIRMASQGDLVDCFSRLDACGAEAELIDLCKTALSPEPANRMPHAGVLCDSVTLHQEGVQERLIQSELGEAQAPTCRSLSVAIAGLMLVLAFGAASAAWKFFTLANHNATRTSEKEEERRLAVIATESAVKNERLARVLLIEANSRGVNDSTQRLLLCAEAAEISRDLNLTAKRSVHSALCEALSDIGGHLLGAGRNANSKSWPIAFSPNSQWMVVGNRLWSVPDGFSGHPARTLTEERVWYVAISDEWLAFSDEVSSDSHIRLLKLGDNTGTAAYKDLPWGEQRPIGAIEISRDGKWLAVSGWRKNPLQPSQEDSSDIVKLWNTSDLDAPPRVFKTTRLTRQITFDAAGQTMAIRLFDGAIRIQPLLAADIDSFIDFPSVLGPRSGSTLFMNRTEDFKRLLSGNTKNAPTRTWDLKAEQPADAPNILGAHPSTVNNLVFSQDGQRMYSAGSDSTVREWNFPSGNLPSSERVFYGHTGSVLSLALTPDERWLISGSADSTIRLWDLKNDEPNLSPIILHGLSDQATEVVVSPDGRWLVAGGHPFSPRVWDLPQAESVQSPILFAGHGARFNSDGTALLSQDDRTIKSFPQDHTTTGFGFAREMAIPDKRACFSFSQNGNWLIVARNNGNVDLYDSLNHNLVTRVERNPDTNSHILRVAVSNDGQLLFTADATGGVSFWQTIAPDEYRGGQLLNVRRSPKAGEDVPSAKPFNMDQLLVSSDKRWLIANHTEGIDVCQLSPSMAVVKRFLFPPSHHAQQVGLSPNGQHLVMQESLVRTNHWDLSQHTPRFASNLLPISNEARPIYLANTRTISVENNWRFAKVLKLASPSDEPVILIGHSSRILCVALSLDERWAATGSRDGTIRIWDLHAPDPSASPLILRGHDTALATVAFHPSGKQLVSSAGGKIRIWDLELDAAIARARTLAGRELTPEERLQYRLDDLGGETADNSTVPREKPLALSTLLQNLKLQ